MPESTGRCRCGSEQLETLRPKLFRLALRLCGNAEDAEDLTQATLARACEKWELFDPDRCLSNWCVRILFNLFCDRRRRLSRSVVVADVSPEVGFAFLAHVEAPDRSVSSLVDGLPGEYGEYLRAVACGYTHQEIAEAYGVGLSCVNMRIRRARIMAQQSITTESEV